MTTRRITAGGAILAGLPAIERDVLTGESLARTMARTKGIGPGFNALRLGLALLIFYAHTKYVMSGDGADTAAPAAAAAGDGSLWSQVAAIKSRLYVLYVPLFFALSGFLVTGSAVRLGSVRRFLWFRALRIVPALTVEVALSALILGALFTSLPLGQYFTDPGFWRYFGNIAGLVEFRLPGVFEQSPNAGIVNANLWTLPAEFYCYALLAAVMALGLMGGRVLFLGATVLATWILFTLGLLTGYGIHASVWSTPAIVLCFFAGMGLHLWRDHVPMSPILFVLSGAILLALLPFPDATFLMPVFIAYVAVYVGHMRLLALPFLDGRDYSYGLYLYGFPITQATLLLLPGLGRMELLGVALTVTLAFAALSWHLIEKPALRLKR